MNSANIILVESKRANAPSFANALRKKGFLVSVYHRINEAIEGAKDDPVDMLILDAASMRTSGARMCRRISRQINDIPLILISPEGSRPDPTNGASIMLVHPFTPRKLLNRVTRLLPADERHSLVAGPIWLNMAQRRVRCLGKESRLTPKQAKLLELLMKKPGHTYTRKALMKDIWQTDYTGDTRTLDVHMSWLRHAIEKNPSKPQLLKTVRGIGYRLDLPD